MTLLEAAFWTKIFSRVFIVGVVLFVVGYYVYMAVYRSVAGNNRVFKPDFACGTLPPVRMPPSEYNTAGIEIKIEAEKEALPDIPPIAYVYKLDIMGEVFSTRQKAETIAKQLGFKDYPPQKPKDTEYLWQDPINRRFLKMDTSTLNFQYNYVEGVVPPIPNINLPPIAQAPMYAKNILSRLGLYTKDLDTGKVYTYANTISGVNIAETSSLQTAHTVRVDFQKSAVLLRYDKRILTANLKSIPDFLKFADSENHDIEERYLKEYTALRVSSKPYTGNISVYLKGQTGDLLETLQRIDYNNWKIETLPCGTYPIARPSEALVALKGGRGSLAYIYEKYGDRLSNARVPNIKSISIFTMKLVYLETEERQSFLQPIYLAEGEAKLENGTVGYVGFYIPAVRKLGK